MKRNAVFIAASLALLSGIFGTSPAQSFGIYMDGCPIGNMPATARADTIEIRSEVSSGPAFVKAYSLASYHDFSSEVSNMAFEVLKEIVRPEDGFTLRSYMQGTPVAGKEMTTLHIGMTVSLQDVSNGQDAPVTVAVVSSEAARNYSCTSIPLDRLTPPSVMAFPRDKQAFLAGYRELLRKQVKARLMASLCPAAEDSYSFCKGAAAVLSTPPAKFSAPAAPSYLQAPEASSQGSSPAPWSPPSPARKNYK